MIHDPSSFQLRNLAHFLSPPKSIHFTIHSLSPQRTDGHDRDGRVDSSESSRSCGCDGSRSRSRSIRRRPISDRDDSESCLCRNNDDRGSNHHHRHHHHHYHHHNRNNIDNNKSAFLRSFIDLAKPRAPVRA